MDSIRRTKASQKVTLVGAVIDLLLSVLKVIVGFIGNSGALIADGIHSFSDLLSDWVVWYAAKHAGEAPDEEHPYGHERFETVATLGLSIFLAIIGTGIIFDAAQRLSDTGQLNHTPWLFAVAAISIVSKEALYWYTVIVANKVKSDMLKANAWHHRSDAFSSIVVLIGIYGAANGYFYLDSIAAIIVGLMIIFIAWKLGIGATKELVDTSIDAEDITKLRAALSEIKGVNSVHSLRTRRNGHKISADVHVQVNPFLSVSEGHIISVSVERVAQDCVEGLTDVTVHIDPEDDDEKAPYEDLPERAQARSILQQALKLEQCDYEIERTQLHYLDGSILVDFYLSLDYLKTTDPQEINNQLSSIVGKLPGYGEVKVYFG
ncbi:MAG: cation diffusion facilitator family transporter [Gammaproteobacteria bacterium]|nr:cation diffusion facilitator family transporter [Gammaproteobacteria bacterium]